MSKAVVHQASVAFTSPRDASLRRGTQRALSQAFLSAQALAHVPLRLAARAGALHAPAPSQAIASAQALAHVLLRPFSSSIGSMRGGRPLNASKAYPGSTLSPLA